MPDLAAGADEACVRLRVVYLMGAGRSGSTVVGVALGSVPGITYVGQLEAWVKRGGKPNFGGRSREEFWAEVGRRLDPGICPPRPAMARALEHSACLLHGATNRHRGEVATYRNHLAALLDAVAATAGDRVLVDSSHYPRRAARLRRLPTVDLFLIWLVRDPREVVRSFRRRDVDQPAKGWFGANAYLCLTNLLSLLVFVTQPVGKRRLLRFEDVTADPAAALAPVLAQVGVDGTVVGRAYDTGIPLQGNRLLRSDQIRITPSGAPPPADSGTLLLQLPWLVAIRLLERRQRSGSVAISVGRRQP